MVVIESFIASLLLGICIVVGATSLLYWVNDRTLSPFIVTHRRPLIAYGGMAYIAVLYVTQALQYRVDPVMGTFGYHWLFLNLMMISLYLIIMETGSWFEICVWILATCAYVFVYSTPLTVTGVVSLIIWSAELIFLMLIGPRIKAKRLHYYTGLMLFGMTGITVIYAMYPRPIDPWFWVRQILSLAVLGAVVGEYSRLMVAADKRTSSYLRLATSDQLTGLSNLTAFNQEMLRLTEAYQQEQAGFAIFECDLDYFKAINDRYGHPQGNEVLKSVAQTLQAVADESLLPIKAYRIGGEEFCLVVEAEMSAEASIRLAKRLHEAIGAIRLPGVDPSLRLTVFIGSAEANPNLARAYDIYAEADRNLYLAKRGGRNAYARQAQII